MSNFKNNKVSSNKSFGILFFIIFFLLAFYPLTFGGELKIWSLFISLIFLVLGLFNSKILNPLNRLWLKFGIFLGKIISPIILGIIFFLMVTPIGLIMRAFKKNFLNLKYNDNKTYWIKKTDLKSKMKNQF